MPHIVIHLSGQPDATLTRRSVDLVTSLTQTVLGKKLPVIAIAVQYIAELARSAFHLDISITDETNTKAEKALYLRKLYEAMATLRVNLHEVSYVHLIDARATAYGYGGLTQEHRHQQAGV